MKITNSTNQMKFIALLTVALSVCTSTLVIADSHNAPEGWKADDKFAPLGIEAYQSNNGALSAIVDRKPVPAGSHEAWFIEYIKGKLSKHTLLKLQGPIPMKDGTKKVIRDSYFAMATAKNKKGQLIITTYGVLIREEAQVWQIFWNSKDKSNAVLMVNALNFMSEGGRKGGAPEKTGDLDKLMADLKDKSSKKSKTQNPDNASSTNKSQPFVAAKGEGVQSDQLRGVVFDFGKSKTKQVWVNDMPMRIPTWQGAAVYMVFKDGWAYKSPSVPPADLDVTESRRVEPKKWMRWKEVRMNTPTDMMPPLKRGTRIDISVQRPSTSSSSRHSVRTNWKNLTLTHDGRFETGSTTISSRQTGIDSTMAPSSNSLTSSNKDGSFTGLTNRFSAGGGVITQGRSKTGGKGNHTGTYLIDGNTIELRYDDGSITRAVFGFDGEREIIFGGTNYWVQGASK